MRERERERKTYTWILVFHYLPELLVTEEVLINVEMLVEKLIGELEEDIGQALDCHHYSTFISLNPLISSYNSAFNCPVHVQNFVILKQPVDRIHACKNMS